MRSPGCSEVADAKAEQVDFYCPKGALCGSLAGAGRKLMTSQPLTDIHREPSTLRGDEENQEGKESDRGALCLEDLNHHSQVEGNVSEGTSQGVICWYSGKRGVYAVTSQGLK